MVSFSLGAGNGAWSSSLDDISLLTSLPVRGALFQIPSWLSLILIVIYLVHRLRYRMFQSIKLRNFVVYLTLLILSLSTLLLSNSFALHLSSTIYS